MEKLKVDARRSSVLAIAAMQVTSGKRIKNSKDENNRGIQLQESYHEEASSEATSAEDGRPFTTRSMTRH